MLGRPDVVPLRKSSVSGNSAVASSGGIVTVPAATPVATPLLFIVAIALFDELQLTELNVGELPSV